MNAIHQKQSSIEAKCTFTRFHKANTQCPKHTEYSLTEKVLHFALCRLHQFAPLSRASFLKNVLFRHQYKLRCTSRCCPTCTIDRLPWKNHQTIWAGASHSWVNIIFNLGSSFLEREGGWIGSLGTSERANHSQIKKETCSKLKEAT